MVKLPFGFEKPLDSPGFLLWQTTMVWQRNIKKALDPYEISHPQFVLMATLLWFEAHGYDTTQTLMIQWSKLDKMTVSKSLRKLETRGFVKRAEHETDTRAKSVILTERGKEMIHILVPLVEKTDETFFGVLGKEKEGQLIGILGELTED
jgi:DNA-binding MarR family transcriptional regulator